MQLAQFILNNMETLLAEWETFAATLTPAAKDMSPLALRAIMPNQSSKPQPRTSPRPRPQRNRCRSPKGAPRQQGNPADGSADPGSAARPERGFDINQLVAEYRALRASVLRLWQQTNPRDDTGVQEITRFNEAINQAIAESVGHFHAQMEKTRNLLLGMLGHDMRTPHNAIVTKASYLGALNAGDQA